MDCKFKLGRLCATRAIATMMEQDAEFMSFVHRSLDRYTGGDWGDVYTGERIIAAYGQHNWRIWIVTEWDRSATTVLFPEEY